MVMGSPASRIAWESFKQVVLASSMMTSPFEIKLRACSAICRFSIGKKVSLNFAGTPKSFSSGRKAPPYMRCAFPAASNSFKSRRMVSMLQSKTLHKVCYHFFIIASIQIERKQNVMF